MSLAKPDGQTCSLNAMLRVPATPRERTRLSAEDIPAAVEIVHHTSGATVWHPLEEKTDEGVVQFYADAEAVLARMPRRASTDDPESQARRLGGALRPQKRWRSSFVGYG
jgi:hypothetical protein